jgi:hypothetical protein
VRDYLWDLSEKAKTDKNARINKAKILSYMESLIKFGTRIGKPIVHHYIKKSQKIPKREIEKAMHNIKDWLERNGQYEKL